MILFETIDNNIINYDNLNNKLYLNNNLINVNNDNLNDCDLCNNKCINLRIILGNKCNFKCKYCIQDNKRNIEDINNYNIDELCNNILNYLGDKSINTISFWGGEGLLYFNIIKEIINNLNNKIKNIDFITNGLLLSNNEIINYIKYNNINVTLSYDGPGQFLRGPDILDNVNIKNNILYLIENNKILFNQVLTNKNNNINNYFNYIYNKLNINTNIKTNIEYLYITDDSILDYTLSSEDLSKYILDLYNYIIQDNNIDKFPILVKKIHKFLNNLNNTNYNINCHANLDNTISIDLNGNIYFCQNSSNYHTNIKELNKDNILYKDLKAIKNFNSICNNCHMKYICNGGCSLIEDKYQYINCKMQYYYYLFELLLSVSYGTNSIIKNIEIN